MNFDLGEVWHYNPHGVISKRRERIKALTYEHEDRSKIEWKYSFDSWPINTMMEIETQASKDEAQKRTTGQAKDVKMEDVHPSKMSETKEIEEE